MQDGSYLKLTVGKFTGPAGNVINEIGVKPNIQTNSAPIFQAHYDAIKAQYIDYQELTSLKKMYLLRKHLQLNSHKPCQHPSLKAAYNLSP